MDGFQFRNSALRQRNTLAEVCVNDSELEVDFNNDI
jgi:hypothetical protein